MPGVTVDEAKSVSDEVNGFRDGLSAAASRSASGSQSGTVIAVAIPGFPAGDYVNGTVHEGGGASPPYLRPKMASL